LVIDRFQTVLNPVPHSVLVNAIQIRKFLDLVGTMDFCKIGIDPPLFHRASFLSHSSFLTSVRISSSVFPAILAAFKVFTSLDGQPTARPPNEMGLGQSPCFIRK
jgi:hypothetical protein